MGHFLNPVIELNYVRFHADQLLQVGRLSLPQALLVLQEHFYPRLKLQDPLLEVTPTSRAHGYFPGLQGNHPPLQHIALLLVFLGVCSSCLVPALPLVLVNKLALQLLVALLLPIQLCLQLHNLALQTGLVPHQLLVLQPRICLNLLDLLADRSEVVPHPQQLSQQLTLPVLADLRTSTCPALQLYSHRTVLDPQLCVFLPQLVQLAYMLCPRLLS